jgi:hypothetical protein
MGAALLFDVIGPRLTTARIKSAADSLHSEAVSCSLGQLIPITLRNLKVHDRVHKNPSPVHILTQTKPLSHKKSTQHTFQLLWFHLCLGLGGDSFLHILKLESVSTFVFVMRAVHHANLV